MVLLGCEPVELNVAILKLYCKCNLEERRCSAVLSSSKQNAEEEFSVET